MRIYLYSNKSDKNVVAKNITKIAEVAGTFRGSVSLLDPVIELAGIDEYIDRINYIYIVEFGRYYYINSISSIRNGLWALNCHIDVLMSWKDQIKKLTAIVRRQENEYNLAIYDNRIITEQKSYTQYLKGTKAFTDYQIIIPILGN